MLLNDPRFVVTEKCFELAANNEVKKILRDHLENNEHERVLMLEKVYEFEKRVLALEKKADEIDVLAKKVDEVQKMLDEVLKPQTEEEN